MPFSAAPGVKTLTGNGSANTLALDWPYYDKSHVRVIKIGTTGAVTALTHVTHYTLTDAAVESGGTLTMVTTPATGEYIKAWLDLPFTQNTRHDTAGADSATTKNQDLDKIWQALAVLNEKTDRAFRTPFADTGTDMVATERLADLKGKLFKFNTTTGKPEGVATTAFVAGSYTIPLEVANGGTGAATAAAARSALSVAGLADANTFTKSQIWTKGADIVSAATLALGTDGNFFDVTGATGPVTAITVPAGKLFMLHFDSTPTLTHHATNLNLPGAANIVAAAGDRLIGFATAANQVEVLAYTRADGTPLGGTVLQVVETSYATYSTTATAIPFDDTIPQNTEGAELMTLAITPKNASSKLYIDWCVPVSISTNNIAISALFVDTTADALEAVTEDPIDTGGGGEVCNIDGHHVVAAASTTARTYKVRAGPDGGTLHFNGSATLAARRLGGVLKARLRIMEVGP